MRCNWVHEKDELMLDYHDFEYGRKKCSDNALFEKLCLEIFQAGLSWRTVLGKREALRRCFLGFNVRWVARMSHEDVERLMRDESIIRNRRKIEAVMENARLHAVQFAEEGSFVRYVYSFSSGRKLSKDLKKRGYRFIGETICESFLMSVGAIEGHEKNCYLYKGESVCRHI